MMIVDASSELLKTGMPLIERHSNFNQIIISVVAFIVIALIITIKILFKDYFYNLLISIFRPESSLKRNADSGTAIIASTLAGIAAILSVSATIMVIAIYYKIPIQYGFNSLTFFFISLSLSVFYYLFYKAVIALLGFIVDLKEYSSEYSIVKSDIYKGMSLLLIPLYLFFPMADAKMYYSIVIISLIVIVIALIVNFVSFFSYLIKIKFLNHYSFLYFCILEILPLLVLAKLIGI